MFPLLLIAGIHAAMMAEESNAIGKSKYYYCEGLSLSCDDVRLEVIDKLLFKLWISNKGTAHVCMNYDVIRGKNVDCRDFVRRSNINLRSTPLSLCPSDDVASECNDIVPVPAHANKMSSTENALLTELERIEDLVRCDSVSSANILEYLQAYQEILVAKRRIIEKHRIRWDWNGLQERSNRALTDLETCSASIEALINKHQYSSLPGQKERSIWMRAFCFVFFFACS